MPAEPPSLAADGLTIRFGGHAAVDGVTCAFMADSLTAIVGPNGAGKTTFFNLLSGQLPASAGRVLLRGEDVTGLSAAVRTRRGLGRAFQLTQLFPRLTVRENVRLAVQSRAGRGGDCLSVWRNHRDLGERADDCLARVALAGRGDAVAATLSHGDQRKLEVAMLLALEPDIFLFDEPTAGMSVDDMPAILELIRAIRRDPAKTVILVEHKMDVVRALADRVVVLHQGRLLADGAPADIIALPLVQQAYLGVRHD